MISTEPSEPQPKSKTLWVKVYPPRYGEGKTTSATYAPDVRRFMVTDKEVIEITDWVEATNWAALDPDYQPACYVSNR